jgi:hypothetical protein
VQRDWWFWQSDNVQDLWSYHPWNWPISCGTSQQRQNWAPSGCSAQYKRCEGEHFAIAYAVAVVAETLQAVFLVGGFGSSGYMKEVIQKSNPGMLVIQPKEA